MCNLHGGITAWARRIVLFVLCSAFWVGCSTSGERGEDYSDVALPYDVGIFFDERSSTLPSPVSEGAEASSPRFHLDGEEVAERIAEGLSCSNVVAYARVLDVSERKDALSRAKELGLDYLIAIGVQAPEEYSEVSRPWGGWVPQIGLWLFGGIPSWFVPGLHYETDTSFVAHLVDPQTRRGARPYHAHTDGSTLSLWSRSDRPKDYALTIFLPPMFVRPTDRSLENEAITGAVLEDLIEQFAEELKPHLADAELSKPLRVEFVSPETGSEVSGDEVELELAVFSERAAALRKLDVRRFAEGAKTFRSIASDEDIERWNEKIKSGSTPRAGFSLPVSVVPGTNVIKVRVLRADGERVTRTVVYHREEN